VRGQGTVGRHLITVEGFGAKKNCRGDPSPSSVTRSAVTGGRPGPPGLAWDTKPQDRTVDSTPRDENLIPYFTLA
jgi:hypothetical protein